MTSSTKKLGAYIDPHTLKLYYLAIFVYVTLSAINDIAVCIQISCAPLHIRTHVNQLREKWNKLCSFILLLNVFHTVLSWLHLQNTPPQNQNKHSTTYQHNKQSTAAIFHRNYVSKFECRKFVYKQFTIFNKLSILNKYQLTYYNDDIICDEGD